MIFSYLKEGRRHWQDGGKGELAPPAPPFSAVEIFFLYVSLK